MVEFCFSDYLDPRLSDFDNAISLRSGRFEAFGTPTYDPLDRCLRFTPAQPLVAGLRYELELDAERLRTARRGAVEAIEARAFTIREDARDPGPASNDPIRFTDVAPLLHGCTCHTQEPLQAPTAFGYADLLDRRATQDPARRLVEPGRADRSYLVEKVLPGYPDRFGTEMPPPWPARDPAVVEGSGIEGSGIEGSGTEAPSTPNPRLDTASIRRIIAWIDQGAVP